LLLTHDRHLYTLRVLYTDVTIIIYGHYDLYDTLFYKVGIYRPTVHHLRVRCGN